MAGYADSNGQYVLDYFLKKLAGLSAGLRPSGGEGEDIALPNESGMVDPQLQANASPWQQIRNSYRAFAGK